MHLAHVLSSGAHIPFHSLGKGLTWAELRALVQLGSVCSSFRRVLPEALARTTILHAGVRLSSQVAAASSLSHKVFLHEGTLKLTADLPRHLLSCAYVCDWAAR